MLMLEAGDRTRPILIGCLPGAQASPFDDVPVQVELDAEGIRMR